MKRRDFLRSAGALTAALVLPVPRPPIEAPAEELFFATGARAMVYRERIAMTAVIPKAFATLRTAADTGVIARRPVRSEEEAQQLRAERERAEAFSVHPLGGHCHCPRCVLLRRWASASRTLPTYPGIRTERFREVRA